MTAPEILSGPEAVNINPETARILWTTDIPCDSRVRMGIQSQVYTTDFYSQVPTTKHEVDLSGLSPGTRYYYVVQSSDGNGDTVQSKEATFQTLTPALREALGLPDGISGVTVSELAEGSELAEFGVGRGDVIMGISGRRITRLSQLAEALVNANAGDRIQLELLITRPIYGELIMRRASVRVTLN